MNRITRKNQSIMNRITKRISLFLLAALSVMLFSCSSDKPDSSDGHGHGEWDDTPIDIEFTDLVGVLDKEYGEWVFTVMAPNDFIPDMFWEENNPDYRLRYVVVDPPVYLAGFKGKKVVISGRGAYGFIRGGDWNLSWEVLGRIEIDTIELYPLQFFD